MPTLTMLNQKGGVGKTSTCFHLAGTLAKDGRRVLLVDADPQSSLTQGFLGPQATRALPAEATMAAVYAQGAVPELVIRPTTVPGVDLVPGARSTASFNVPDPHLMDWPLQVALRDFLAELESRYDLILIDVPPNLYGASWAALVASDGIVVPLQPEDFGAQGIEDVLESVERVVAGPNPSLRLLGYLITMHNPRLAIHQGFERLLRQTYPEAFTTTIPISTDMKESLLQRKPVAQFKPRGAAAKAMKALADELLERLAGASCTKTTEAA